MSEALVLHAGAGAGPSLTGPRVLIASVSAGTGHVRAAEAVLDALRSTHPLAQAVHINVLDHSRPGFRHLYEGGYAFLVTRLPGAWEQMYRWTDREGAANDPVLSRMQQRLAGGFLDYVRLFRPDRVVATHFLIPQLLSALSEQERPPVDVVVTDFDVHQIWIHPGVDRYFVAGEAARQRLMAAGVDPARVQATGIPVHPAFLRPVDGDAVRQSLGLSDAVPTVLVLAGGRGATALDRTVESLFASPFRLQIIAVAGRNTAMLRALQRLRPPESVTLKTFGFVTNIHELMSAADLVVSKPGGLTVAEGLAKGVALVLHSAIPGQEEKNADFVARHDAGVKVPRGGRVADAVFDCLNNLARLHQLRERSGACGRPRAAFAVAHAAFTETAAR